MAEKYDESLRMAEAGAQYQEGVGLAGIDPLVPWRKATFLMGLSPSTADRRRKSDPEFPPRVAIGPERWGLFASDIRQWNETRPTDREVAFEPPKKSPKKSPKNRLDTPAGETAAKPLTTKVKKSATADQSKAA